MVSEYISFGLIGIIRAYWYSIPATFGDIGDHLKGCRINTDNTRRRQSNILPVHGKLEKNNRAPTDSKSIITNTFFGRKTATRNTN